MLRIHRWRHELGLCLRVGTPVGRFSLGKRLDLHLGCFMGRWEVERRASAIRRCTGCFLAASIAGALVRRLAGQHASEESEDPGNGGSRPHRLKTWHALLYPTRVRTV